MRSSPSVRHRRRKKLWGRTLLAFLACGILAIAGCGAYRRARDWSIFSVRSVSVRGISEELVSCVLEAGAIKTGTSMLDLNRELIRRRVSSLDFVRDVRIRRRPPGRVVLDIIKREPFALINGDMIVGKDGREVRTGVDSSGLPRITCTLKSGSKKERSVDPDLLQQAVLVLDMARDLGVAELDMSRPEDLQAVLDDGTRIRLGRGGFAMKLPMVSLVIDNLRDNGRRFRQIDARFCHQIIVKR